MSPALLSPSTLPPSPLPAHPHSVKDESSLLDSKTTATWYCLAADVNAAANILATCNSNQRNFNDELEDSTSALGGGEIELETVTCGPVVTI